VAPAPVPQETIAFVSDRTGNPELWVMNADGSNQIQLTNTPDIERQPKLSPDGTQIVFVRGNGRSGGFPDVPHEMIWVVDTDGSDAHSVFAPAVPNGGVAPPIVSNDRDPSWSPDGTQIAFSREGIGITMSGIMVMNADGSGARVVRPMVSDPARVSQLAWSPDGTRIAYTYDYVCCAWHIVFVNADGSGPTFAPLIGPRNDVDTQTSDRAPAWSPDGSRIAFTGQPNVNGTVGAPGLWVANATGAPNPTALAPDGAAPAWSPGGARIAFERAGSIWTMDADGSNQVSLTTGGQPSWAPKN
jgi:Tol biopolymer transport system component